MSKANTGKTRSTINKTAAKVEQAEDRVVETEQPKAETKVQYKVRKELPPHAVITVRNGFNGKLIYKSARTHERFVWESFGDEQDMELQELKNAKNSYKKFFENNWFLISDPDVIESLGVEQYYKHALSYEEFDSLFTLSPEEVKERIALLSKGQKASVRYRAKQLIADGQIDSIKMINALEECLGVELIER